MSSSPTDALDVQSLRDSWPALSDEERADAFRLLPFDAARECFTELGAPDQSALLRQLSDAEASLWLRFVPPDDAADLLQELEEADRERISRLLDPVTLREATALLAYAEDEAGGLMNPRFARVRPDVTVEVAIRYLRKQTQKNLATHHYAYVLDAAQRLLGVLSFSDLFAAPDTSRVDQIMVRDVISVPEDADQETVADVIARHDLTAVPVVDEQGRMKGVVTVDDIVDVVREEATEDIQKLGGMEALPGAYLHVSFGEMIRKRGGWLSILFLGEMLTTSAMGYFEHAIEKAIVLAMFVPLIISSGGNSGSQAATLIVRSLALHDLRLRDWLRVFGRELKCGAALGAWLGLIGFARVALWQHAGLYDYGPHYLLVAFTVAVSLLGVVLLGTLAGSMLPFLMRTLGFDPATSSTPFVATLVDVAGVLIYFGVASLVLSGSML